MSWLQCWLWCFHIMYLYSRMVFFLMELRAFFSASRSLLDIIPPLTSNFFPFFCCSHGFQVTLLWITCNWSKYIFNPFNFSVTRLHNRQWKCMTCVSQRPIAFHSFPSGPKLICCGQIVCKGENVSCCLVAELPSTSHLHLSQHQQTAAALTAGREKGH